MPGVTSTIQTEKTTLAFFHQHVRESMKNQNVIITKTSEQYIVQLLADFTLARNAFNLAHKDQRPLAIIYQEAQFETASRKIRMLKELGDFSLFITGFFPDSLNRKIIDVDYYIFLGRSSYGTLSSTLEKTCNPSSTLLFDELAEKFVSISDILAEISSKSSTQWNDGILRLYERWLKTRSKRDERLLSLKGIIPNRTIPHTVVQ